MSPSVSMSTDVVFGAPSVCADGRDDACDDVCLEDKSVVLLALCVASQRCDWPCESMSDSGHGDVVWRAMPAGHANCGQRRECHISRWRTNLGSYGGWLGGADHDAHMRTCSYSHPPFAAMTQGNVMAGRFVAVTMCFSPPAIVCDAAAMCKRHPANRRYRAPMYNGACNRHNTCCDDTS